MSKKTKNAPKSAPKNHTPRLDGPEADAFDAQTDAEAAKYAADPDAYQADQRAETAKLIGEAPADPIQPVEPIAEPVKSKVSRKSASKASLKSVKEKRAETRKAAKEDPKLPKWKGSTLLPDVADGYLASIEEGMTVASFATYKRILATMIESLGAKTDVASISTKRVLGYMTGDEIMKKSNGTPKAAPSINQHRRVVRHMLVWAERSGIVEKAPVPELEAVS